MTNFVVSFTDPGFWSKTRKALKVSRRVILPALRLYYMIKDRNAPRWAKAAAVGDLGYYIVPLDAVPDIGPLGYGDDLGLMVASIALLSRFFTPEVDANAQSQLARLLGD
jgi:uncharacterized membrane protein YkvA (DUF1232 family)